DISDYLNDVSDLILKSMTNSIYPFRLLAREFNLNNNVVFEYNYDLNDVSNISDKIIFEELAWDPVSDLLCVVNDLEDGYNISVEYSDYYSKDTMLRFIRAFEKILLQILDKDYLSDIHYTSISDLELLNDNNHSEHLLKYDDIVEAFNDSLTAYPNSNLVLGDEASYTYAEGAYLINRIKELLNANDIGANDKVSVFVDRNHWVLLSNMGILSAGATYVPIDENHPNNRIKYMIEKSESKAIITTDTFQNRANKLINELDVNLKVINVSSLSEVSGKLSKLDYTNPVINDTACILFTSGTTGNPKAVPVGRHSIANMVQFYRHNAEFRNGDVYGVFASVGFDVSLQHYAALLTGGAVTWVPNSIRLDITKLNEYFVKYGVTHTIITTQVSKLFVDNVKDTSLKNLSAVGEKLGSVNPPQNYTFLDVYGPTEATSSMTSINVIDKIDDSSVGYPDWNTKIYLLDDEQRRIPFGAVGELYISGYQVSKGYLNNPEANAKAFFMNPFDGELEGYERMYKTGDVARFLPDGTLGFIGRNDSQVKIRGNRVELSEIEWVIRNIDYVEDVTVQTFENNGNNELVAYVVVSEDIGDIEDRICEHVKEHKPSYMVPSFVIKLDKLPLNVNGKLDKKALPEVDLDMLSAGYVAPRNATEKIIVDAFGKVFNQEKIGINDDFIRLGGDSLTAIKLLPYLEDYNVTAADILSLHTPHEIANNIDKNDMQFDLDIYSLDGGCPLNEPQLNVYLDIISNEKTDSYIIPVEITIPKNYSSKDIVEALNKLLNVHPILGMCVDDSFEVPYLVKGSKPQIIQHENDRNFIQEFLTKAFDLDDSLSRFLIIDNGDNYTLFSVFNHIIFDALSGDVFKNNLFTLLNGGSVEIDDSFLKVSAFNQQIRNTDEYNNANNFYSSMLMDADDASILLDSVMSDGPGVTQINLDLDYNSFKSFLKNYGVNENIVFTSAFAYTLSKFTGNDLALFNITENGRDRFNFNSVGMYVNTLPMLVDCKNQSISSFMDYLADLIYNVIRYNYYPFRLLAKEHNINSSIIFQFLPDWIIENNENEIDIPVEINENEFISQMDDLIADLSVEVIQKDKNYILNVRYSNKYSKELMESFAKSYKLILNNLFAVNKLSDINYIDNDDIKLLDNINRTEHELMYNDVLDAFNDNLAKCPKNNLVFMNNNHYSYGEGAYIADRIAKQLMELGVKAGGCVGFLTGRCEYYMFSILGILSVGAV
ncbi:AMP-binding protein, partial [Methanobrevibacter sp.]|uniref:non-ribosomal peptide synthetase n=1 Tax=Methanobrevibacter sp. TaxID=66852 RepID=UPI003890F76F